MPTPDPDETDDAALDEALKESFPASDPPAQNQPHPADPAKPA